MQNEECHNYDYGTWYGFDRGGFVAMFANLTYLHIYDNEYDDEKANENHFEKPWVIDMCELMRPDDTSPNVEKEKDHNQPSSSSTSMEKMLAQMGDIMQEIINEVKEGGGSIHRSHHIIVACYCNICTRYSPSQGE